MAIICHDRPFSSAAHIEAEAFLKRLEEHADCVIRRDPSALGMVMQLIADSKKAERDRIFNDPDLKMEW